MWIKIRDFLVSRWRGEVALGRVYWRDMLMIGTAFNVATLLATLVLTDQHAPWALVALIFVLPIPYTILVYIAVWLAAGRTSFMRAALARSSATLWLVGAVAL